MAKVKEPSYKYCMVPMCKRNSKNSPDKVFFRIPTALKARKQWCKMMKKENVSPLSRLYCCEDHFNVKEDTANYIQYSIMKQQGEKCGLRLKNGVVPHIFLCQERTAPQPVEKMGIVKGQGLALVKEAIPELTINSTNVLEIVEPPQSSVCDIKQAGLSPSSIGVRDDHQAKPHTFHIQDKLHKDKAVQVNIKPKYRSKHVNANILTEKKNVALSPLAPSSQNIGTSPIKQKRKPFIDNPADSTSISSSISSVKSSDSQLSYSYDSSSVEVEDDSEDEKKFKNAMRSSTLTVIAKEPKMLLGLTKQSYHLIKLLTDNIPLPTVHILITLKKIKLNESFSILALQFGYSQSTITRVFSKSIPLIAAKLKDLIVWPSPSKIYENLPISFRSKYANVVSIIDCLEIQIEKPSDAVHQSLTWSNYKKCNTLKYLISCTPDGLVNFISDGYGGRATDIMIVQDCDYLQCLPPNKAVMADRGFKDLSRLLEAKKCTLIRPPSVSKSTPSTKDEVKLSKQIAALRIHVERVINRLREFHMLLPHACVDHNLISIMDYVILVACGLVNMQDVLIKK